MKRYPHLATRLFGTPLLIAKPKLDAILAAVGPRLGLEVGPEKPSAYGPGDPSQGRERKSYYVTEDGIAVVEVIGPLVKRDSGEFLSGGPTTYTQVEEEFTDAATDPNIKGILLLVDSPGGESTGAMELSDLIYSQRGSKPIVAVADGDAFSAAYALASAADRVFVIKSGGVGSVGVWMLHVDWSKANEQEGIDPTYLYAGARKIDGNPDAPLSEDARKVFQDIIDGTYQMFVATVARNRGMSEAAVRETEAGLFWGEPKKGNVSAVKVGFADQVGGVADAFAWLKAKVGSPPVVGVQRTSAASVAESKPSAVSGQPSAEGGAPGRAASLDSLPAEGSGASLTETARVNSCPDTNQPAAQGSEASAETAAAGEPAAAAEAGGSAAAEAGGSAAAEPGVQTTAGAEGAGAGSGDGAPGVAAAEMPGVGGDPAGDEAPAGNAGAGSEAAAAAEAPGVQGTFEQAKGIIGLCALAGLTARQALGFLKAGATLDSVRQELLDTRGATGVDEIHSHILPEAGAMAGNSSLEDSKIYQACKQAARKEQR